MLRKIKKFRLKTKKGVFDTRFERNNDEKGYIVRVMKIPEIVTGGDSLVEAKYMAREAIEFALETSR